MSDDRALKVAAEILRERDPAVLAAINEYAAAMDQTFLMAVCQYIEMMEVALNGLTEARHYSLSDLKEMGKMPALYNEVLQRLKEVAAPRPVAMVVFDNNEAHLYGRGPDGHIDYNVEVSKPANWPHYLTSDDLKKWGIPWVMA